MKALALPLLLLLLAASAGACPDMCNGHGMCDGRYCDCDNGWKGSDCSIRRCPWGTAAWADGVTSDNVAHNPAECSARGHCDEVAGECQCAAGYEGSACERSICPGTPTCSGHGTCYSMADAAETKNDVSLLVSTTYTAEWDAYQIHGCACDEGWTGYNCSYRECPRGDDIMTTGQVDEVQVVDCTCAGGCDGSFTLSYKGEATVEINHDDPELLVEYKIELLSNVDDVTVAFTGGTTVCDADGVSTAVTFLSEHGDLPDLLVPSTSGTTVPVVSVVVDGAFGSEGPQSVVGDKEWAECSNRGTCDWIYGNCTCFTGFSASDGQGAAGFRDDCGAGTTAACPTTDDNGECNGHGSCSGATEYTCTCEPGWEGPACERNSCPGDRAWFDEASAAETAHAPATPCSNAGMCEYNSGTCYCDAKYDGIACENQACPTATGDECSGHGSCYALRDIAPRYRSKGVLINSTYTVPWDQNKTHLCLCDAPPSPVYTTASTTYVGTAAWGDTAYDGYNCSLKLCPTGDDPLTPGQDEVQKMQCYGDQGVFYVYYKGWVSNSLLTTLTETEFVRELETIEAISKVEVSFQSGKTTVCDEEGTTTLITFLQDFSDIPIMNATWTQELEPLYLGVPGIPGNVSFEPFLTGSKENVECSNHGFCNRDTGMCVCDAGWQGSDGHGNKGQRGDCGHRIAQNGLEAMEEYRLASPGHTDAT